MTRLQCSLFINSLLIVLVGKFQITEKIRTGGNQNYDLLQVQISVRIENDLQNPSLWMIPSLWQRKSAWLHRKKSEKGPKRKVQRKGPKRKRKKKRKEKKKEEKERRKEKVQRERSKERLASQKKRLTKPTLGKLEGAASPPAPINTDGGTPTLMNLQASHAPTGGHRLVRRGHLVMHRAFNPFLLQFYFTSIFEI